ncbi:MAG: hypothetical protein ACN4GZ_18820, partial [Acidimicrobiales bacterium]
VLRGWSVCSDGDGGIAVRGACPTSCVACDLARYFHPMRRAASILALALLTACSGGSDASDATTTTPAGDRASSSTIAEATTTTTTALTTTSAATSTSEAQFALPDSAQEQLDIVQLDVESFGPGYVEGNDDDGPEPLCEGVDALVIAFPPEAESELSIEGDHLFFSNIAVYPTADEAVEALEYLDQAYQSCDGKTRKEDDTEILLTAIPFSPPSILGTDRLVGLALEQTTPELSVLVHTRIITADRLLFFVGGTEPDVVQEMADVLVSRTRLPAEPVTFMPDGGAPIGPGYANPFYFSYPAGPDELRALELGEGALQWLNNNSDERVDEVASTSCVITQELNPGDSAEVVDAALLGAFSESDRNTFTPEELGEVYGAANAVYCPGLSEYLFEVLDAIPE